MGAIVMVASGATGAVYYGSGTGESERSTAHKVTFTVVERATSDTVVDNGVAGDSVGDLIAFGNPIYNATNTVRVGRDQGSCVRTNPGKSYECEWTLILPEGHIVAQGPFQDSHDSTMAITGGTGRYRHASGQMVLHARNATSYQFRCTVYQ
ncbi:dirigent protein [Marmoricola sp. URHA0025 HA25]